ncbi:2-amino-4-hydroxy-6-hydroxymethyldihydropteridine diphosphokinase [Aurantibacter sp.]|uniref:2-amino-4-hydroxy-6- hydroxymethyldihydropteridine diphosphokinase n=1 Tax=Aurantibacter sp. TaxID=2807103 RepID=UPI0035C7A432
MITKKTVHIALGSNKGDKYKHLQDAINNIYISIGSVKQIGKIYKTKALDFDGYDFYNTCISVTTTLSAFDILEHLQEIEKKLGRQKTLEDSYENREIDLDIILFENDIIETPQLTIPHLEAHNRKFVLQPLQDIAKDVIHPKLNKSITDLLEICKDDSAPEPQNIWLKKPKKQYNLKTHNYIAIEGNIGAGKTSLTHLIAEEFNAKPILERFADNPFLPKFYEDATRYAFTLEMSFLADRYQQITDDLQQLDLFKDFMISDYDIYKSLIFSKITLPEDEFNLYKKLFNLMYKDIPKPDLYIYLYQNTERLQENIKKRGRDYEQNIEDSYLEKINSGYLDFLKTQTEINFKLIDISNRDFVNQREDYIWLLSEIFETN